MELCQANRRLMSQSKLALLEGLACRIIAKNQSGNTSVSEKPSLNQPRPTALVTGASSGIGAATALQLVQAGYHVHALARRRDRLETLAQSVRDDAGDYITPHSLDVTDSAALTELVRSIGRFDVLVNNAGLGRMDENLANSSIEDITATVNTNVTASMVAASAVLPSMIDQRHGHIVNVGSMAGLYPLAAASYGASKGAIHLLSLNLRMELRGTGIRVTEICPGRIATEFYDHAISNPEKRAVVQDSGVTEVTAEEVADAIVYALSVPPHVNINRIELQPTEQTYGGSQFDPVKGAQAYQ